MVHIVGGPQPIERIAVGDRVWSFDHRNLRWVERPVAELFQNQNEGPMATIRVAGETIRATGGHPFWVVEGVDLAERRLPNRIAAVEPGGVQPGRWVLAMDLRAGDVVLRRDGEISAVDSVEVDRAEETVYNFRVEELQNYAVGACGVLVHNTNEGVTGGENDAPNKVSSGLAVEPVERIGVGKVGRDFVRNAEDGLPRFEARLLDGDKTLRIGWTDNIPRTAVRLREVQELAGGPGSFTRITGLASAEFEASVRAGTFDLGKAGEMLGKSLGGKWDVKLVPHAGQQGVFDVVAELIGG